MAHALNVLREGTHAMEFQHLSIRSPGSQTQPGRCFLARLLEGSKSSISNKTL